jgi:ribosomal protein L11 methyltransferase
MEPSALEALDLPPSELRLGASVSFLLGLHFEADFAFLFFAGEPDLSTFLAYHPLLELRQIHHLRYDQWQDGAGARPFKVGPLSVRPFFGQDPAEAPGPDELLIDPGLAFGFGGHPTTKTCLEFLLKLYLPGSSTAPAPPRTVLDLGAGTGILAMAAVRLGAERAFGVDLSHLAVDAARRNLRLNGLESRVGVERGQARNFADRPAELLTANVPLFVLKDLIAAGAFRNRRRLIVSGLLVEEGETFLSLLDRTFRVADAVRTDRWSSYLLESSL